MSSSDRVYVSARLAAGKRLAGRFTLIRALGHGGMGQVWLAEDHALDNERIAIKLLRDEFAKDRRAIADMKREVLLTRRLRHPHILAVYTFWETDEDDRFITMEFVPGRNLADALLSQHAPFPVAQVIAWLGPLCGALDYAHGQRVYHRDVKPGNILLQEDGGVKLADFGIARAAADTRARLRGAVTGGTLLYMSPEQLHGKEPSAASEIYSLGATAYELLSGIPPFFTGELVRQINEAPPPKVEHLGPAMNAVIARALAKHPAHRFASCSAFAEALAEAAEKDEAAGALKAHPAKQTRRQNPPEGTDGRAIEEITVRLPWGTANANQGRLGDLLVRAGVLTESALNQALANQRETGNRLGHTLVELGLIAPETLARTLAEQLRLDYIAAGAINPEPAALRSLRPGLARFRACVPLRWEDGTLIIAMADPLNLPALEAVEHTVKAPVRPMVTTEAGVRAAIERAYASG